MATYDTSFRNEILHRLRQRKAANSKIEEIFAITCSLYSKNDFLEIQNAKLVSDLQMSNAMGEGTGAENLRDRRIYELQEELTNLHRRKGECTQQILDLKNKNEEQERIIHQKNKEIAELNTTLSVFQTDNQQLKERLASMDQTLETMKDEHVAQTMHLNSLEIKNQKLEKENADLLERILAYKNKDVNDLNAECERYHRMKQAKVKRELEEATRETVQIALPKGDSPVPNSSLPTGLLCKFEAHDGEVNAVKWSDGFLATGGGDRKIKIWKLNQDTVTLSASLVGCNAQIMSIDFNPGAESMVLGASNDFAIRLWTISDCRLRQTLTGHSNKVMAAKFFGDLVTQVVSGSHDRTLKIWDLRSRSCMSTAFVGSACNDVVANNVSFISAHIDRKIRFWDARNVIPNEEIQFQGKVTSLDLSPGGTYLLCCVRDDTLKYLDLRENKVVRTFSHENFKVGCDWTRAKISPDGQYISAGSADGSLIIWNALTGRVEKVFKEHKSTVIACTWSPSGESIISTEKNKRAMIWSNTSS